MLADAILSITANMLIILAIPGLTALLPAPRKQQAGGKVNWLDVGLGCIMALLSMLFPWEFAPGMQLDMRWTVHALIGLLYGLPASAVVATFIVVVRFLIGGAGVFVTLAAAVIMTALVPLFHGRARTLPTLAGVVTVQIAVAAAVLLLLLPSGMEVLPLGLLWLANLLTLWLLNAVWTTLNERRQKAESLAAELRVKEAISELVPYGLFILDSSLRVASCNSAARRFAIDRAPPPQVLEHPDVAQAMLHRTPVTGVRVAVSHPGEGDRLLLTSVLPLESDQTLLGLKDVTEVVKEERDAARRTRLTLLGRLATAASHEIKNPLTTIKGFLQLLSRRAEFQPHRETFQLVMGEVEQINRVISNFLELAANANLRPVPVPVGEVVSEVLAAMELQFPNRPVRQEVEGETGLVVLADRTSLKQVLRNLAANAYEAMPEGGRLTVCCGRLDGKLALTVQDSGPGISADMRPFLFTPYSTSKGSGTGLGLTISQKVAMDMGGDLTLVDGAGPGASFRLILPLYQS